MSTKIEVHNFRVWDSAADKYVYPPTDGGVPSKRTAADINRIRGAIIPGTAETIEASQLDPHGRYFPPKSWARHA